MVTRLIFISGKVQGVFFRASAKKIAENLHIKGWIKNTKDNSVEALVSGENEMVDQFINWCKVGPPQARVINVNVKDHALVHFEVFKIAR